MTCLFYFIGMATRFSHDRYARAKEKKNQPLSEISTSLAERQKTESSIGNVLSTLVHTFSVPSLVV